MKGFVGNIEQATLENTDFRRVLYTAKHSQLVVMSLKPGEEIGEEVHQLDQFIRLEAGQADVILDGVTHAVTAEGAVVIPQGVRHNVRNTGSEDLKLYTIYSPPEHRDGVVHPTPQDAHADSEHFDGTTTEA
jgi:mannose-6-phosphate isomerase-like protein (cupin superfamily)